MARYLCQLCYTIVTYDEKHPCFFYKKEENVYSIPQLKELDELDVKHVAKVDKRSANLSNNSRKSYRALQHADTEESEPMNSMVTKTNMQDPFTRASKRKRKCNSFSVEAFNNSKPGNLRDALASTVNVWTNKVNSKQDRNASFKTSSENRKSSFRSEIGFRKNYKRKPCYIDDLSEQNQCETETSPAAQFDSSEECEMLLEKNKWHYFTREDLLKEPLGAAKHKPRLDAEIVTEASNSLFQTAIWPGNGESNTDIFEVPGDLTDGNISTELDSWIHNGSGDWVVNNHEVIDLTEDANAAAEISAIRPQFPRSVNKRKFNCELCPKGFPFKSSLVAHYRTHTGEKPFVCVICDKSFSQKGNLDTHYRTHTGEKPFACDLCDRSFSQRAILDSHYRTHAGEKRFVCVICDSRFAHKANLDRHYRTHTSEKPFVCDVCNKGFRQKRYLKTHVRLHAS